MSSFGARVGVLPPRHRSHLASFDVATGNVTTRGTTCNDPFITILSGNMTVRGEFSSREDLDMEFVIFFEYHGKLAKTLTRV